MTTSIFVDRMIAGSGTVLSGVEIEISGPWISRVRTHRTPSKNATVLRRSGCSPALINSHDHLKYTWPVRVGPSPGHGPFGNSLEWLPSLYRMAMQEFSDAIPLSALYALGTYKNMLGGVTTVLNHSRRLPAGSIPEFPVRILTDFAREGFVRPDRRFRPLGSGFREELKLSVSRRIPMVVHFAEGTDLYSQQDFDALKALDGLTSRSILVHGMNVGRDQIYEMAMAGASVVWCPASNLLLFDTTAQIADYLDLGVNVLLGTDSTCTGSEDLLAEMRLALELLRPVLGLRCAARTVFDFVTRNAARAFGLSRMLGTIRTGALADILVFESEGEDPFVDLIRLEATGIQLLMRQGRWLLGAPACVSPLPPWTPNVSAVLLGGEPRFIAGDPLHLLDRVCQMSHRSPKDFPLGRTLQAADATRAVYFAPVASVV